YRDQWRNRPNYHQLHLDPLASESLAEFLQSLLGSDPGLDSLKRFLAERANGNPFFVEELVRSLIDTSTLEGGYRLARPFSSTEVPPTVQAVENIYGDRVAEQVERLAHQAVRDEQQEKAVQYLRQAGEKAAGRSALLEARAYFEQALGILKLLPESEAALENAFEIRLELR